MVLTTLLAIVMGILGGLWLSYAAKSELKQGKRWFAAILVVSLVAVVITAIFFRNTQGYEALVASCLFLATLVAVSYRKSSSKELK